MKDMLKMILTLTVICGLSGFTLAALRDVTAKRVEDQELTYVQGPSIAEVFSSYDNNPVKDRKNFKLPGSDRTITVFPAIKDGKLSGVALERFSSGYGGDLGVMVGFDIKADQLSGIGITAMKETPGVGSRVSKHGFTKQFSGQPVARIDLTSKGGKIEGVAGATVSSTAAVGAVRKAIGIYKELKPEILSTWGKGS